MTQTDGGVGLTLDDLTRVLELVETPWRRWARETRRTCRLRMVHAGLTGQFQVIVVDALDAGERTYTNVFLDHGTLATIRRMTGEEFVLSDVDLATWLAHYAHTRRTP